MKVTDKIEITNEPCMDMLGRMSTGQVDLVLTDPPYGMDFQSNFRKDKYEKIKGDSSLEWLPSWISEIDRVSKSNAHIYIWCSWHKVDVFKQELEKHFKIKNILVWAKNGGGMGDLKGGYGGCYEICFFINKGKDLNGSRDTDVIKKAYRTGNNLHPTQKPVNLMSYLIEKSSVEGELVMDCFSGSGSTAMGCIETNRRFIGCELDSGYFETSVKRLIDASSQQRLF